MTRKQIEKAVGFRIRNIKFYQRALVHKSIQKNVRKSQNAPEYMKRSNETIEFLGDSVLGMIIAEYLFRKYPENDEGFLTRLRTRIVKGKTLGRLAKAIGLGDMILMSNHVIKIGGRDNGRILEDAFESIVGAIYMDLGLENARSFVLRVVKENISDEQLFSDDNYKDLLLRYMQLEKLVRRIKPKNKSTPFLVLLVLVMLVAFVFLNTLHQHQQEKPSMEHPLLDTFVFVQLSK